MLTTTNIITQLPKKKNILIPNKCGVFKVAEGIMNRDQLLNLTLRQLRQKASKLSVPLYSRKTKVNLVDLIVSYQNKYLENKFVIEKKYSNSSSATTSVSSNNVPKPIVTETQNITKLVFLPRDPEWAYVFWKISDSDRENAKSLGASKLCLRLFDTTGTKGENVNLGTLREITVDSYSTEWYLPIPVPDRNYKVELGYRYGFKWMSLAFSSSSYVPSSHPSEQILDKFVPFNLNPTSLDNNEILAISKEQEENGLHERLYQAATNYPKRKRVGSEEFMEKFSSLNSDSNLNDSGTGKWSSGLNESGIGIAGNKTFWLVADSELIVYGATDPSAKLTIGGENVPLAVDGTFRLQVPFRDGMQNYEIKAINSSGDQGKSITMKFERFTPVDDTNDKDNAETEWF